MQDNIFRTGYSTIVRESEDASCLLLDADGGVVGEHVIVPLHLACLPEAVRAIRRTFREDIRPGDAFITNDPYLGAVPHSVDMAVVSPVFVDGRIVAFAGSIAHKSDLGGVVPGTGYAAARELFQEGIIYPPVRLFAGGVPVRDVVSIVRANSRTPDLVIGDLMGQVGVARLGERRLGEAIERYGIETIESAFAMVQDVTERRVRAGLSNWPDGICEGESFVENDGVELDRRIRYHVRAEKSGERLVLDFSETDDQAVGPINILPSTARGAVSYALLGVLDPTLPNNGGLARVVETRFRAGSVLSPRYPAPCNTYMNSALAVVEAVLEALSGFVPVLRHAANGGGGASIIAGKRGDGTPFVQYELICSAHGGLAVRDGASGSHAFIYGGKTAPVEIIESEYPVRMQRFELIVDSGGPGRFRGGLAPRRSYEILTDDAQWTLRGGRHAVAPMGTENGRDGRRGSATVNAGTPQASSHPGRFSGVKLRYGDQVTLDKAGGGGFGDPHKRPFEAVLEDVLDGYVSRIAAIGDYGVDPAQLDRAFTAWNSGPVVSA